MSGDLINLENVFKIFNKGQHNEVVALRDISLSVKKNSAVLLRGPSGSGKTTLLTIVAALSKATSGKVLCLDQDLSHWTENFLTSFRRKHIGIIFQNFYLIKSLTVYQNIAAALIPMGLSFSEIENRVQAVADLVQIRHRLHFKASTLSGGEQQRTAIARALVLEPQILIADEPTAQLDSKLSLEILQIFNNLKKSGKTIILATHDPILNEHDLVDESYCLRDGRLEPDYVC